MRWKADHVAFEVSDMDTSISFYAGKLGFKVLSDTVDPEHGERFLFLELEGANLELLQVIGKQDRIGEVAERWIPRSNCPHLAIRVDDLDALVAELCAAQVPIFKGPMQIPGQVRWLYVADPDRNVLEFVQWNRS